MNGKPNKKQKDWHEWLRENGCTVTRSPYPTIQHIKGARMKLKGVGGYAGEWYCYALCFELHLGNNKNSLSVSPKNFASEHGSEKSIWIGVIARYEEECGEKPMSEEEYKIIVEGA